MVTEKYLLRSEPEWRGSTRGRCRSTTRCSTRSGRATCARSVTPPTATSTARSRPSFPADHQRVHRAARRRGAGALRRSLLRVLDARRHVGGRHGPALRSVRAAGRARGARPADAGAQAWSCSTRCRSAMDPVVYDFAINPYGTTATLTLEPSSDPSTPVLFAVAGRRRTTVVRSTSSSIGSGSTRRRTRRSATRCAPGASVSPGTACRETARSKTRAPDDVLDAVAADGEAEELGAAALADGRVAVVTLAAGIGSRWTQGAGVVKALSPFTPPRRRAPVVPRRAPRQEPPHRASLRRVPAARSSPLSHLTHDAIAATLSRRDVHELTPRLSPGPLDRAAADPHRAGPPLPVGGDRAPGPRRAGTEGARERPGGAHRVGSRARRGKRLPRQTSRRSACTPVGHFYEVPNLLLNGTLRDLLAERPRLDVILLHNVDNPRRRPRPGHGRTSPEAGCDPSRLRSCRAD